MRRKFLVVGLLAIGGAGLAAMVSAQESAGERRSATIGERLGQIRQNIIGSPSDETPPQRKVAKPTSTRPAPKRTDQAFGRQALMSPPKHGTKSNSTVPQGAPSNAQTSPPRIVQGTPSRPTIVRPIAPSGSLPDEIQVERGIPGESTAEAMRTPDPRSEQEVAPPVDTEPVVVKANPESIVTASSLQGRLEALRGNADTAAPVAAAPAETTEAPPQSSRRTPSAATATRIVQADPAPNSKPVQAATPVAPETVVATDAEPTAPPRTLPSTPPTDIEHRTSNTPDTIARSTTPSTLRPLPTGPAATVARRESALPTSAPAEDHAHDGALVAVKTPVLSVSTRGPQKTIVGKSAGYQVIVDNTGEVAASDVVVTIKLPPWAEVESARPSSGATSAPREADTAEGFQWRINRLDARSQQQLMLQIIPRKSRPFQLAIQSTFRPEASQTIVEVQEPKLHITVSGPDEMLFGGTESYKITVSNPGTGEAENVVVSTASSGQSSEGSGRVVLGTLPAGEHKVLNLKLTATEAGTMQLKAVASADGGLAADVIERVLIRRAGLEIEAGGPDMKYSGSGATYRVRVTNPGNATAENIKIEVALPPGAKYQAATAGGLLAPDGGKVNWTIPSLRAGAEQAFDVQCMLQAAGENRLQLFAAADGRLSDTASFVTNVEALADLKLEVTDPQGPVGVGEDMVYEIRIRNRGSKSAEGIALTAYFSDGIEPVHVVGGTHRVDVGQVTFEPFRVLEAGDEIVCKIGARASIAGNHVFRAEVGCKNPETRLVGEETTRFYGEPASAAKAVKSDAGE